MEEELIYIRKQIQEYGFMSASKISIILNLNFNFDSKRVGQLLKLIPGDGFYKIEYTNKYIAPYKTKKLFYYNPNKRTRKRTTKSKDKN